MSLLVNSIDVCLKFFWRLLPNLSVFLPMSFQEEPADVCLDWARVSPCQYLSSELNRCQICLSFCQYLFRKSLLMSAWIELACLLASIFLVSSIDVCLKCFPLLVCQCLLVGHLGSCWGGLAGGFHACCPVFLNSPIHRDWGLSLTLYHCLSECFPCFWWSWYPIFFSLWRMPTGCLPLGLPRFCFKTYQISFWSSLTLIFYQDCTSATTCK